MVVFLSLLSLREGRNPTLSMAAQSTTRPSNPPTPKRVAKSASAQSLNHLLNFSLPPRQTQQVQSLPRRSRRHGTTHGVWNKERELPYRCLSMPSSTTSQPTYHFSRLRQRPVPVCNEPFRRLYGTFCRSGHVSRPQIRYQLKLTYANTVRKFLPMAGHTAGNHSPQFGLSCSRRRRW